MSSLDDLTPLLQSLLGGQTLASLREDAAKEMNGTCFRALRAGDGPRRILLACVTGEHELNKIVGGLDPDGAQNLEDWATTSIIEAVGFTALAGGFCYAFDCSNPQRSSSVVFISTSPDSIAKLERVFNLTP